jgi:hypothetical protein
MKRPEFATLIIDVAAENATDEELDRMTRQLLAELRGTDVRSAELAKGNDVPSGSKGEAITLGSIVLELLPAVLPGVIALVQAWVARGKGRSVRFRGKGIEFEGSAEELQKVLSSLEKGKNRK